MKLTAMQELLEFCEYRLSKASNNNLAAWNMVLSKIKDDGLLEMEKEQIKEAFYSGYEDRDKFKHSDDYYDKIYERNDWQGILFLGEVDGVKIYYDSYHPDQTLTVELNEDKTEMVYIISPYDDIAVFDGIKKNIIVSEKTTKMIDTKYE